MKIACLHTADVHVSTFDTLFASYPGIDVVHEVRADLLERARSFGVAAVAEDTGEAMRALSHAKVVLCTCSTLGPLIGEEPHHLRIDWPAFEKAVMCGPEPIVAICLDSTRDATLGLLRDVAQKSGRNVSPRLVYCDGAWPRFEAGDMDRFAGIIAQSVKADIARNGAPDCIVLAQASMRVAAPLLAGTFPVLTTPELAVRAAVEMARG